VYEESKPVTAVRPGDVIMYSGVAAHVLYITRDGDEITFFTSVGSQVRRRVVDTIDCMVRTKRR
jgi:hypothetical protein